MSRRHWLGLGCACSLLAAIGLAGWLLVGTSAGLQLALALFTRQLPAGTQVDYAEASGSLRDGFRLGRLRWRSADWVLEATQVEVGLALEPLLGGGLVVEALAADAARLQLAGGSGWPARVPSVPRGRLSVELRDVRLPRLEVAGGHPALREMAQLQASVVLPAVGPALFDASARAAGLDATVFGRWGEAGSDALDMEFHWQSAEPAIAPASGSGRLFGAGQRLAFTHQLVAPIQAGLTGTLTLAVPAPRWQARVELPTGQRLPWQGAPRGWELPALQFDLAGSSLEAWEVSGEAPCALPGVATARCALRALGTAAGLDVQTFTLLAGTARLEAKGRLAWPQSKLRWQFEAESSGVDPAIVWPAFPGALDFHLAGEGEGASGRLDLSALGGVLRGHELAGEGTARLEEGALQAVRATLRAGRASLALATEARNSGAVDWRFDVPALGELLPAAGGRLAGNGRWEGGLAAPTIRGVVEGAGLTLDHHAVGVLSVHVDLDGRASEGAQSLQVSARQLRIADFRVNDVEASLHGTPSRMLARAALTLPAGRALLAAEGPWVAGGFRGRLLDASWHTARGTALALVTPGSLEVGPGGFSLTPTCWSGPGALCVEGAVQSGSHWRLQFDANAFEPSVLWPGVMGDASRVSGQLDVAGLGLALDRWAGRLVLERPASPRAAGASPIRLEPVVATFRTSPVALESTLATAFVEPLPMPLALQLDVPRGLSVAAWSQWPLHGSLRGDLASLAPLAEQSEELAEVEGRAGLDLLIGGTPTAPSLAGSATVHLAHAHLTRFGVAISDFRVVARGEPSGRLALDGGFVAGEGKVDLAGTLGMADGALAADLELVGERVRFIDLPEASALASGKVKLHFAPQRARVEGTLTLPQASLQMHDRATATRRSVDVVVDGRGAKSSTAPPLDVAMTLVLGPEVALESGGFRGRLAGQLVLAATGGAPLHATGELRIDDGRYTQWGEALSLRDSRLLFADQPLSDPRVDARAEREVGGVTAGLRVTGRLREPEGRLYSNPALPDVDVLSYLVTGQPLSGASSTDARNLLGAAASMGLRGSGLLSQKVASAFGLDALQVGTRSTARGPALDVGTFLSPQLYVGYGAGLLERANTFRLRYLLGRRWSLEAETGTSSGADLLYTIER